jgi:cytidyltransferase-like protein
MCQGVAVEERDEKSLLQTRFLKKENKENFENIEKKKYKKGLTIGTFDLFHIGHINLIRKAKDVCEYLVVGVASDKNVFKLKITHIPKVFNNSEMISYYSLKKGDVIICLVNSKHLWNDNNRTSYNLHIKEILVINQENQQ